MITYCTASGATPERSSAALMAMPPSSTADMPDNEPSNRPMGVRAPATMTEPDIGRSLPDRTCGDFATIPMSTQTIAMEVGPMFMRIDHVGIACHNLEEKIAFFERTFELTVVAREINEEQGVKEAMLHIADGNGG